jgi:hypothetical protein
MMKYIESLDVKHVEALEMLFGVIVIYDVNEDGTSLQRIEKMIDTTKTNA